MSKVSKVDKAPKEKEKTTIKKNAKKEAYDKLLSVFSEYTIEANTEKFDRKIEKAAKLFIPLIIKAKSEVKK